MKDTLGNNPLGEDKETPVGDDKCCRCIPDHWHLFTTQWDLLDPAMVSSGITKLFSTQMVGGKPKRQFLTTPM
jgi:hypothetical protein